MRALSIRQQWAWAILHAGKRCENRSWLTSPGNMGAARRLVGQEILIHAAKGCTAVEFDDALDFIIGASKSIACPPLKDLPRGAIVGSARLVEIVTTTGGGHRLTAEKTEHGKTCLLCGENGHPPAFDCPSADPWAIPGTVGLILADVRPLAAPVSFKGALGFFEVPDGMVEP